MQAQPQSTSTAQTRGTNSRLSQTVVLNQEIYQTPSAELARNGTVAPAILLQDRPLARAGRTPSPREFDSSVSEGAGLAHDAGNLLQALGLYCELLELPGVLRPEHRHYATELRQLSERSSAMILRLLKGFPAQDAPRPPALGPVGLSPLSLEPPAASTPSSSGAQVGTQEPYAPKTLQAACFNPGETLHQQSALLQRLAAPWATISVITQDGLPGLDFSAEILERITVNLVLNAAEALRNARPPAAEPALLRSVSHSAATESGSKEAESKAPSAGEATSGRIRVSLRMEAGRLRLSVEDNGPGMPPSIAAAFLQPAPLPPGTARGLGHRIVHELAMATGGQLSIRVRPGTGTAFCLDWPVKLENYPNCDGPTLRLVSSHRSFADRPARENRSRTLNGGLDAC